MCGEHCYRCESTECSRGSSPRVRGTCAARFLTLLARPAHPRVCGEHESPVRFGLHHKRLIPACAGNIGSGSPPPLAVPAHPRVCGEHEYAVVSFCSRFGSSPRVRGTSPRRRRSAAFRRLIPACAGNIGHEPLAARPSPAHPRVCGEHDVVRYARKDHIGSSPRVAGNIVSRPRANCLSAAHPRVCGEHKSSEESIWPPIGSSPRVRGTFRRK